MHPTLKTCVIHGEIFGGWYDHSEVPRVNVSKVQKGVYYCPDVRFFGFDISVALPKSKSLIGNIIYGYEYLNYDDMARIFEEVDILYAEPLKRGSQVELSSFDVETFVTTLPAKFGLPPIPDNIAEGVVIREANSRKRFKVKSQKFWESWTEEKGAKNPSRIPYIPTRNTGKEPIIPDELKSLYDKATRNINANRLDNVLSKTGESVTYENVIKIGGLLSADAYKDFLESETEENKIIILKHKKFLTRELNRVASNEAFNRLDQ